jgi:hypothetical protein
MHLIIVDPARCEHKPRKSPDCTCSASGERSVQHH